MNTIYPARRVITMNQSVPFADAVAVCDDQVLGVGTVDDLRRWGDHVIDDRFAGKVIVPGFIEAHSHVMAGAMWQFPYVGYFERPDPNGVTWPGCRSIEAVIAQLQKAERALADPDEPLVAWGLDPIYMPAERLLAVHLDEVSRERPIFVFHASAHLGTVNSAMLRQSDITIDTTTPGVARDGDGKPNGELQEPAAMMLAGTAFARIAAAIGSSDAKWNYAFEARNAGHTLVADLGTTPVNVPSNIDAWREVTDDPSYPVRVMVAGSAMFGGEQDPHRLTEIVHALTSTPKLRFGIIKMVLDGSIQGFTARVSAPYYYDPPEGHPGNGLWLVPPDQVADIVLAHHAAGLTIHAHCNGDQATQVFLDAVENALVQHPRPDHRHTVQHCQLTTPDQYRRMAAMGMCANLFANHTYYWGDQHRDITVGPERAAGMNACATASRAGVSYSIHSDAPITPMGHLHTAWCAVNRVTATGVVLGEHERIDIDQALRAITIDAAFQLKLDHELGSIEAGKLADFAILEDDPLEVEPSAIKDIEVWGTVLGGVPFPASASTSS